VDLDGTPFLGWCHQIGWCRGKKRGKFWVKNGVLFGVILGSFLGSFLGSKTVSFCVIFGAIGEIPFWHRFGVILVRHFAQ